MSASAPHAILFDNLVHADSVASVPVEQVRALLNRDSFACVRGLFPPSQIERVRRLLAARFTCEDDRALDPSRPELVQKNFQTLTSGTASVSSPGRGKLVRTFYNPVWDDDVYGMREMFRNLTHLRNVLMGLPLNFAEDRPERDVWTASRLHQYPCGGGFMATHRDTVFAPLAVQLGVPRYYQVTLLMSRKGDDFREGGAYFMRDGLRILYEDVYTSGDVVVIDDRIEHGVAAVDPSVPFDASTLTGRLAAFVTLYRVL